MVLLAKVCGCHPSIFGLVLTQRTNHSMADEFCPRRRADQPLRSPPSSPASRSASADAPPIRTARRSAAAYPAFANNSVFLGGPVGPYWSVLSPKPTRGGFPIAPGVHVVGSLGQAHADVLRGELAAEDVRAHGPLAPSLLATALWYPWHGRSPRHAPPL